MSKKKTNKLDKVRETAATAVARGIDVLSPVDQTPEVPAIPEGGVPKITNETITEHREEVLSGARKYIYPLAHSKRRIVAITVNIIVVALIAFGVYTGLALYKFYQYNSFLYRVTQLLPLPIAKVDGHYVDYENYLFELRQYVHYYQTQQQQDFNNPNDAQQLLAFRKQALNDVVNQAYVKILAQANHVSVSDQEVNTRVQLLRDQNRIGSSDKVFTDVLRNYYGWSINDFKRSLKQQILTEKVTAALDPAVVNQANEAVADLNHGADFTTLAKKISTDKASASNGGDYGFAIDKSNPNVPPQVVQAIFSLSKVGQTSSVVNTGTTLEIVQLTGISGASRTAAHISLNLEPISTAINQLSAKHPARPYVHF